MAYYVQYSTILLFWLFTSTDDPRYTTTYTNIYSLKGRKKPCVDTKVYDCSFFSTLSFTSIEITYHMHHMYVCAKIRFDCHWFLQHFTYYLYVLSDARYMCWWMAFVGMCCIWFQSTCAEHPCRNQEERVEGEKKTTIPKKYNAIKCRMFDKRKHVRMRTRQTMEIENAAETTIAALMRIEKSNFARADNRVWLIILFRTAFHHFTTCTAFHGCVMCVRLYRIPSCALCSWWGSEHRQFVLDG